MATNKTEKLSQSFEDKFRCSRCLKDHIEVPDMIGLFASSATASLVAKTGTKNYISHLKMDFDVQGVKMTVSKYPTS